MIAALTIAAFAGTATAAPAGRGTDALALFTQSVDVFTLALLVGSIAAGAVIVRALLELRGVRIDPEAERVQLTDLLERGLHREIPGAMDGAIGVPAAMVTAAEAESPYGRQAMRDAADLAASAAGARVLRVIEPLSIIGHLGPLVGLAGTVWGMILAFTALGASGGEAGPAALSLGISKALFHTLLGLVLAIPCLLLHGLLRGRAERLVTGGVLEGTRLVERIPASDDARSLALREDAA